MGEEIPNSTEKSSEEFHDLIQPPHTRYLAQEPHSSHSSPHELRDSTDEPYAHTSTYKVHEESQDSEHEELYAGSLQRDSDGLHESHNLTDKELYKEPHNSTDESHDSTDESHDSTDESHNSIDESHNSIDESHDSIDESREEPHDLRKLKERNSGVRKTIRTQRKNARKDLKKK